jgi:penicillin-binding protein 1C
MARVLNHYNKYNGKYDPADFHSPVYSKQGTPNPSWKNQACWMPRLSISTFQAMEEVMRPGEEMLWQQFSSSQRVAWKTGTSFGFEMVGLLA